jgi:choline dehydrogenase-like flavoprotein
MTLSPKRLAALRAVCDAFVPALSDKAATAEAPEIKDFWLAKASDFTVAEKIALALDNLSDEERREFLLLLDMLASPAFGVWGGKISGAAKLSPERVERTLQSWSKSSIPALRKGFHALKKLTMFLMYGYSDAETPNPTWRAIGYPGPAISRSAPSFETERYIKPLRLERDTMIDCDVVIVGSGAGGGVVAGELTAAGFDVVVVEKGKYGAEQDFTQREAEMIAAYYEAGGAYSTSDGGVSIFAGSCLGGGTTVNWSAALRTPDYVLEEWATKHDNPHFISGDYQRHFEAVEAATHVDTDESAHNKQNQALERGARALGYDASIIPRNAKGCVEAHGCKRCGYCSLGCADGTKMSVVKAYLEQAFGLGARFLTETEAESVIVREGKAVGVLAYSAGKTVRINAKAVVVATGSLHTPALLRRSGLSHPHIGRHLHLHPTVSVAAIYDEDMEAWHGNMMTALSNEFTRLSGTWGVKLETPPVHSGLLAMALPWLSGKAHKEEMLNARRLGAFIVLTRDKDGGEITLNKRGRPSVRYAISPFDLAHLQRGILESARIHQAAGASRLYLPHNHTAPISLRRNTASLEAALGDMYARKWRPNDFPLFSAHQMGTCRMGGSRATHPLSPEGETYEAKNLFVADASAFPEASGANPMLSIQALAHYTAQRIKERL